MYFWELREIFGHKWDEVKGKWKKFIMRNFVIKYYSGNQIKNDEMGGVCSSYGERSAYTGF
jgi:hypothetical protein